MVAVSDHLAPPDTAEIDRIVAQTDTVVRNLQITLGYSRLSTALAQRTGAIANWCTFATWASKQAGQTIRGDDARRLVEQVLDEVLGGSRTDAVIAALRALGSTPDVARIRTAIGAALGIDDAVQRASDAVMRGNVKVFTEIARAFALFIATCARDTHHDDARMATFAATLRAGEPPDGQDLLRNAFTHLYASLFEADADTRTELQHLASVEIGWHEQNRLQPEIRDALEAAIEDPDRVAAKLIALLPWRGVIVRARRFVQRILGRPTPLDHAVAELVGFARARARAAITAHIMVLDLPGFGRLRLGEDLRVRFPEHLDVIANPELRALLDRIDPSPDSPTATGARDWADLGQRMHFIADLFRCFHAAPTLLDLPFAAGQISEIEQGRKPPGRL